MIEDFAGEYEREIDYWDATARVVRGLLETELTSSGLRAIVTSRAKSVDRLVEKLRGRNRKKRYRSVTQIRRDIVDLAGVRVALYFPGQMDEAERVIRATLNVEDARRFPPSTPSPGSTDTEHPNDNSTARDGRTTRFSGYGARHYRVRIPAGRLSAGQERYSVAMVEIQVASVLMHAWSEVEHDLVYKPLEGGLSESEYALLDQLNGLVLAGEIALEQLQQAGDARVTAATTPFRDHYELAEFLRTRLANQGVDLTDTTLGRVDVLHDFLSDQKAATAASVGTYLDRLELDFEQRPVADQLADLMLSGDEHRYKAFLRAMAAARHPANRPTDANDGHEKDSAKTLALGEFVASWVLFEAQLGRLDLPQGARYTPISKQLRALAERDLVSPEQYAELTRLRNFRNQVIHTAGDGIPVSRLRGAAEWLRELTRETDLRVSEGLPLPAEDG